MTAAAIDDRINGKGYITGNETITLSGDVSGSGTTSIAVTIADDSHNHVISNVDGLQVALDAKLANVAEDTSPQLGGNLDVNGNDIVTTSNADIDLDPNGSGVVVFKGNSTKGSGQFKLNCEQNSHGIVIKGPPHSAGAGYTLTLPNTDGNANEVLKTDGSGNLDWVAQSGGGASSIDGLSDVDTSTSSPSTGDLLQWNGSNWVPYTHTNGITEVDQWRLTADITSNSTPISSNLSRAADASFSKMGTGMSVSSGVWSFPSTGLWKVSMNASFHFTVTDLAIRMVAQTSTDGGSNWIDVINMKSGTAADDNFAHGGGETFVNVTNTSNVKVRFNVTSIASGNSVVGFSSSRADTYFSFMRLGDSQ